ncbi:unnamed protein product [Linum tenue]|uniref:ATP synthase F0 subunit 8 n=1 Tax=Linum tenue TaxID=586396 RepID=A0AAV0HVJ5_9ROSI|nr:unnamed protein product [Linum tenue]
MFLVPNLPYPTLGLQFLFTLLLLAYWQFTWLLCNLLKKCALLPTHFPVFFRFTTYLVVNCAYATIASWNPCVYHSILQCTSIYWPYLLQLCLTFAGKLVLQVLRVVLQLLLKKPMFR